MPPPRVTLLLALFTVIAIDTIFRFPGPAVSAQQFDPRIYARQPDLPLYQNDRLLEDFRPAKELLEQKGVSFEPELLLRPDWARRFAAKIPQMPEMQVTRQLSGRVKGVHMGDTLYLPEKVEITGDTVIIANHIIFEGRHAVMKGPHSVYFYPVVIEGVLGTSLEAAMEKQQPTLTKVSFNRSGRLRAFVPQLLQNDWSLTIDTNGFGREQWLEREKKKASASLSKISLLADQNTSGDTGAPGPMGPPGEPGANGEPNPAAHGYPPFCGTNNNMGGNGENGEYGQIGGTQAETGGIGGTGGSASPIFATVTNSTGIHTFLAKGGNGGQGGIGGPGGTGGTGAQGGDGRNGLDCACNRGGAGSGSNGGRGGKGGKGGNGALGGPGGQPGRGRNITVTVPPNFTGTIVHDEAGGRGGPGGQGGDAGFPGQFGAGGAKGNAATTLNCPSSEPHDGEPGLTTGNLGSGTRGNWGSDNQNTWGPDGQYFLNVSSGPIGGCGGSPFPNGACSPGFVNVGGICTRNSSFQTQCYQNGGEYDIDECGCTGCGNCGESPVLIDTAGDGFALTNAANGVSFDLNSDGIAEQLSWTDSYSNDGWLVLDRNFNGVIDDGKEMFGDTCSQPTPPAGQQRNGFLALADFDSAGFGGNADGVISRHDFVFARLRLWTDSNHNGTSDPGELKPLVDFGLRKIELAYEESRRVDQFGNQFKYRARVRDAQDAQLGRWAWDVYLVVQQP